MKNQYIVGIITGASLMLALFVFIGSGKRDVGRYQAFTSDEATRMIDTKTGEVFRMVKPGISTLDKNLEKKHDSPYKQFVHETAKRLIELQNPVWISFVTLPSNDK